MTYAATAQSPTVATGYNEWSNYETWLVSLWLNNEESSYCELMQLTALYSDNLSLGDAIKEWVRANQAASTGMYADLINASLNKVDWYEIADNSR